MRVPKFHLFSSENLPSCRPLPPSPLGLIAVNGHNFPLFEMLELERAWLFSNHFRLNSRLRRRAEAVIAQYRRRSSCLIALHVRRTDYKELLGERSEIRTLTAIWGLEVMSWWQIPGHQGIPQCFL